MLILAYHATLAQLVEQLIRNQQVGSSNLLGGSKKSRSLSGIFCLVVLSLRSSTKSSARKWQCKHCRFTRLMLLF